MIDLTKDEEVKKEEEEVKWYKKMPCSQRWYSTSVWLSQDRSPHALTSHKAIEAHLIQIHLKDLADEGCVGQRQNHLDDKDPPCGSVHHVDPTGGMYNGKPMVHQTVWSADGANLYLATTCNTKKCVENARNALIKIMEQYPLTVGPFLH